MWLAGRALGWARAAPAGATACSNVKHKRRDGQIRDLRVCRRLIEGKENWYVHERRDGQMRELRRAEPDATAAQPVGARPVGQ